MELGLADIPEPGTRCTVDGLPTVRHAGLEIARDKSLPVPATSIKSADLPTLPSPVTTVAALNMLTLLSQSSGWAQSDGPGGCRGSAADNSPFQREENHAEALSFP
uniref:Uncharacterized protein n=1 Tax=Rhodosorus marinus TaxID=101924 RepID=A0A7S2ZDE7_9RHOD